MSRETFQVQSDGFFDIALSLLEGLSLRVAAGKSGNRRDIAAFGSLFVKDGIRISTGNLALHQFHCRAMSSNW